MDRVSIADSKAVVGEAEHFAELRARAADIDVPAEDLIDGQNFRDLTLYEKKSVLIDRELDRMGMGKYQWCIFFLCGFGYFLDLCYAQAFGLVAFPIQVELGVSEKDIGNIFTAFSTGLTVGAFFWGLGVDIFGRRWCFNLTCGITAVFGLIFAAPSNFGGLCFITSLIGFGVGGNIPIDATITLEFLPRNRRWLLACLSTFQPIGVVVSSVIAFGLVPNYSCADGLPACSTGTTPCCTKSSNMGWRYFFLTIGSLTFLIFVARFVLFNFLESPKWLIAKGHDARALEVIRKVAAYNKAPVPDLTIHDFEALDFEEAQKLSSNSEQPLVGGAQPIATTMLAKKVARSQFQRTFGHLRAMLKGKRAIWLASSMAVAYMALFFSFSIAGSYLPLILRARGVDTSLSVTETYRSYVYIYLPGITATLLAGAMMEIPKVGRKWSMVLAAALMGVSLILFQLVNSRAANIGFNAMEYWFQSLYAALLYAYTPEAFPAMYRGSASGMLSTLGRLAGIVAPVAAGRVYNGSDSPGVLYLAGGAAWVSMLAIATLPYDTKGKLTF